MRSLGKRFIINIIIYFEVLFLDVVFTTWFLQKQILLTKNILCVPVKSHENPCDINMQIFTGASISSTKAMFHLLCTSLKSETQQKLIMHLIFFNPPGTENS